MSAYQMTKNTIAVCHRFAGIHYWPDAPDPVAFLRNPHRHLFEIQVWIAVGHADRQIEFFMAGTEVEKFILENFQCYHRESPFIYNLGCRSCEMLAKEVLEHCQNNLGWSVQSVSVREDQENIGIYSVEG